MLNTSGYVLGALILAATAAAARAEVIHVKIDKLTFMPAEVTAHVGDTIEWDNADFVAHTATARNGSFDVMLAVKANKSVALEKEGVIDYYCKLHPNMTGRITVNK